MSIVYYQYSHCGNKWDDNQLPWTPASECPKCRQECMPIYRYPGAALSGCTTPHAHAWDNHGTWGRAKGGESLTLAETRARLEAGDIPKGRLRTDALTYSRCYELAVAGGLEKDGLVEGMRRVNAECDRLKSGEPKRIGKNLRKVNLGKHAGRDEHGRPVIEQRMRIE